MHPDAASAQDAHGLKPLCAEHSAKPSLPGGIPGAVAGMEHVANHYGRLPLSVSLQPAIQIARQGFELDEKFIMLLKWRYDVIKRWPAADLKQWETSDRLSKLPIDHDVGVIEQAGT